MRCADAQEINRKKTPSLVMDCLPVQVQHFLLRDIQFTAGDLESQQQLSFRFPPLVLLILETAKPGQQTRRDGGDPCCSARRRPGPRCNSRRETRRRLLTPQSRPQIILEVVHLDTPFPSRCSFPRSTASERCRLLFTVPSGMPSTSAISAGSRSS